MLEVENGSEDDDVCFFFMVNCDVYRRSLRRLLMDQAPPRYRLTPSSAKYLDEASDMCMSRLADWYFSEHHMGEFVFIHFFVVVIFPVTGIVGGGL